MKVMSGQRDPCRSPMQWDDSINSGFTSGENTWLPVNPSYLKGLNVQDEIKNESSPLNVSGAAENCREFRPGKT